MEVLMMFVMGSDGGIARTLSRKQQKNSSKNFIKQQET
jgi:hypothetical protein